MAVTIPANARGPILDLYLPVASSATFILLRNKTTGLAMALALPAEWDGDDLAVDFYRRTITDQTGSDRSALLSPIVNELWLSNAGFMVGENTIEIEAFNGSTPKTIEKEWLTTPTKPSAIAVNATHIFWTEFGLKTIGRATLAGASGNNEFIKGLAGAPNGIAVDSNFIYWADEGGTCIGRATLAGGSIEKEWIKTPAGVKGVAVNATHIFWVDPSAQAIGRAKLDGSSPEEKFIPLVASLPNQIAVDSRNIYWGLSGGIGRATLDGLSVNNLWLALPASEITGVAVDLGSIYWGNASTDRIGRANLDGSDSQPSWLNAGATPSIDNIAINATHIFNTDAAIAGFIGRSTLKSTFAMVATLTWEKGYY